jgi:hypothetical protein
VVVVVALVAGFVQVRRAALPDGALVRSESVRTAAIWRWAGVIAGMVVGGAMATSNILGGRGLMLAAPLFGICVLAGVLVGEAHVRPFRGPTRVAALEVRGVRDYLPRGLTSVVAAAAVLLVVLLIATTAAGSADDLGRAGRMLQVQCRTAQGLETHGRGPWPGSFYSIPLALVVIAGLIAAWAALRQIVRRPRSGPDPTAVAADDALRQRAARGVTAACGILVAIPLLGVSMFTAPPLLTMPCRPAWWSVAGWGLVILIPGMVALICWCMAAVVATTPSARTPRSLA